MKLTKNKGEWSELYVLLYLLSKGVLFAADEKLHPIKNIYFPVLKVFREDIKGEKIVFYNSNILDSQDKIDIYINDEYNSSIATERLTLYKSYLLDEIQKGGNRSSFEIEKSQEIMEKLHIKRITAPSTDKTDIKLQLHDIQTGYDPVCGFSIKSELGNSPTLLNASNSTNFIYHIEGISDKEMEEFNDIDTRNKIKDRMLYLKNHSNKISFLKTLNSTFADNLMMIDTLMDDMLGELILDSFLNDETDMEKLVGRMEERDTFKLNKSGLYRYKFKKLLCAIALGMLPSKSWDGKEEANGGYIVVTEKGSVVAFHIYNRDFFEEYLLKNTKLERGSTTRHNYSSIYKNENNYYINLNLQIRFV